MYLYKWLSAFVLVCLLKSVKLETVRIVTSRGSILGQENDGYNTFFGIPYALVDEENPFGNSLDAPNFTSPFNAIDRAIKCPQVLSAPTGVIQCLRLNIYAPDAVVNNKLPVLVWFHGGGFVKGSAGDYSGRYFMEHDIIVITVNYRLGPYGFFCLNHPAAPGNQGLKDQVTALKWIKENIAPFGGDPDKVTIAGGSYGGGAVDLHLYSTYDKLFDKAIIQSGSIFAEGFFSKPDEDAARKIASHLGHPVSTTTKALRLLSKLKPRDVVSAAQNLSMKLTVCKEKHFNGVMNFIDKDPFHLKTPERGSDVPVLIGYNNKEDFGSYANKPDDFFEKLGDVFYKKLEKNLVLNEHELKTLSNNVKKFYLGDKEIGLDTLMELTDFSSDFMINHPVERSVNKYIEQGRVVYKYLFSYIGGSMLKNYPGAGAIHTEELKYLFEMKTVMNSLEQRIITERMTTMWSHFVKFGVPTPEKSELMTGTWLPVTSSSRPYLNIDTDLFLQDQLHYKRMAFWDLFWHTYSRRSVVFDGR
ncbi:esterase FE4-like [Anticarsia gemmatalis]|uniref:esterase FE4-like n=1 Tax=Anticarsia gemmatalis TaxID=129554 RepID=UPI003F764C81